MPYIWIYEDRIFAYECAFLYLSYYRMHSGYTRPSLLASNFVSLFSEMCRSLTIVAVFTVPIVSKHSYLNSGPSINLGPLDDTQYTLDIPLSSATDDEYCYLIFDNYSSATFIDGVASHDPTTPSDF